jgi:hypothetical protein
VVTLTAIQVTPAKASLPLLYSQPYTATGVYSDNSTQDLTTQVTWSVTPASLATISSVGVLTTSSVSGSGTVSAALGSVTGTTPVTVTSATLQSIQITPSAVTVPIGATQAFAATGIYKDSSGAISNYDVGSQPGGAWHSGTTTVASIDSTGLATALAAGQSSITFTLQSVTSSPATMTVPSGVTLTSITIDGADPITLFASGAFSTTQLTATATYSDGSTIDPASGVTWSLDPTSATNVVSVNATTGLVTAIGVGTAIVDVSDGSFTDTITVQVTAVTLSSITVSSTTPSVPLSLTTQYTAAGSFSDGSTADITDQVTWTVQNPAIASVSNSSGTQGLVTPLATGSTTVVATLSGVTGSASLTVTPATLVSIALTPAGTATLPLGFNEQFFASATFTDGNVFDVTTQATWTSDTITVATVSNATGSKGVVAALATGTTNIRASIGSISSPSTLLTVDVATLVSITVTPSSASIVSNGYQQYVATGAFSDGSSGLVITKQVNWHVTRQKHIVTISNVPATKGLAHASRNTNKKGTVTVTATLNGVTSNGASLSKTSLTDPVPAFDAMGQALPATETAASPEAASSSGSGGVVAPLVLLGGAGAVWARKRRRRRQAR